DRHSYIVYRVVEMIYFRAIRKEPFRRSVARFPIEVPTHGIPTGTRLFSFRRCHRSLGLPLYWSGFGSWNRHPFIRHAVFSRRKSHRRRKWIALRIGRMRDRRWLRFCTRTRVLNGLRSIVVAIVVGVIRPSHAERDSDVVNFPI